MSDLPDEIQHITAGIFPLSLLLSRLAQISHNHVQELVAELATKPIAQNPAANGNPDYRGTSAEDTSSDSLEKKRMMLNFIQDLHAKWVKALVITEWSRKAELVGKLIDLKAHLYDQHVCYAKVLSEMVAVRRELTWARLPSPDLKTALAVLSSGEVSWMPEFNFIEPPSLTAEDQISWLEKLNTLLSVRLSLDDYDNIPHHFRDYSISSGRVTFRVAGEFEVDLTIADEDFAKQFWFIDFRFLFAPAPKELSDKLRSFIEGRVNDVLETSGLRGCYEFLHGYVLTHKINEFTRQVAELTQGRWTETLKIERLNRAMSVQYWLCRPSPGLKSWIILGTDSGKTPNGYEDVTATSRLTLRWFRDNKEVKDCDIAFDHDDICAEDILKIVISRHIEHILSSIHRKLLSYPRFRSREASLSLETSLADPTASKLVMQLSHSESLTVRMDPLTGTFSLTPQSRIVQSGERNLNMSPKDPAEEGFILLEKTRCFYATEELTRRGKSSGWSGHLPPVKPEELKAMVGTRDPFHSLWLKRQGWGPEWFVLVTMSLGGDRWWLVEVTNGPSAAAGAGAGAPRIKSFTGIQLTTGQPDLTDVFFDTLTTFVTGMMSTLADLRTLHNKRIRHSIQDLPNYSLPPPIKMPCICLRLSELVPSLKPRSGGWRPWAMDVVQLMFKSVRVSSASGKALEVSGRSRNNRKLIAVVEARLSVTDRSKFNLLRGNVDHDVSFNPRLGQFSLRLRAEAGQSIIDSLATRLQAIARLVDFVDTMRQSGKSIVCESVTLREVIFTYGDDIPSNTSTTTTTTTSTTAGSDETKPQQQHRRWKVWLDLAAGPDINIKLEADNPHLRVLDKLKDLANSASLKLVPAILTFSLPMLRSMDAIERSWDSIAMDGNGSLEIFDQTLFGLSLLYKLPGSASSSQIKGQGQGQRALKLSLGMRPRKGSWCWFIARQGGPVANAEDEFSRALKPIWDGHGEGWRGVGSGATATAISGIERLLSTVDGAVRALAGPAMIPSNVVVID